MRAGKTAVMLGAVAGMTLPAAPRASAATSPTLTGIIPYEISVNSAANAAGGIAAGTLFGAGFPAPASSDLVSQEEPMAPGTSASVVGTSGLGYESAFQGSDGDLWFSGTDFATDDTTIKMAPGTSPATAPLSGSFQAAWQGSNGDVFVTGPHGPVDLGVAMAAGTSPSIVEVNGGYEVAVQGSNGDLWFTGTNFATADTTIQMAPGTSPATALNDNGSFQTVWQGINGDVWSTGPHGPVDLGAAMAAGTSPGITQLNSGGYEVAVHGSNGDLWTSGTLTSGDTGLPMLAGTSPSIAATISITSDAPADDYYIAYASTLQNGAVMIESEDAGPGNLTPAGIDVVPGTSPSLTTLGD